MIGTTTNEIENNKEILFPRLERLPSGTVALWSSRNKGVILKSCGALLVGEALDSFHREANNWQALPEGFSITLIQTSN